MHESMEITDHHYGQLARDDVRKAIMGMGENRGEVSAEDDTFQQFQLFKRWLDTQEKSTKKGHIEQLSATKCILF